MLFTTTTFALLFLPLVLAGFFVIGRFSQWGAAAWLFGASLFFYAYWLPIFTLLLVGSICTNFFVGLRIAQTASAPGSCQRSISSKSWLAVGVGINLALLGYFKYVNFFLANLDLALGTHWDVGRVILPIGISFYTFTQIAFLVDTFRRQVNEYKFVHYGLFVTYFPHLIAGPVLHHGQMMPQFGNPAIYRFDAANFAGGLAIFALGLIKKVVLADGIAPYADAIFKPADAGLSPDFAEAWLGASAYTLQLYFDFSGYSDMAIGLSRMFNIDLPFNFNSPYRATSISDFWRRWHISLSNFLRDYLYIALGGNRRGRLRRYSNLAVTMLLGGLWHGAGWSFVLWGGLHGAYLMINHAFRAVCSRRVLEKLDRSRIFSVFAWGLTMLSVIVAWVFFRAESFSGAMRVLQGMAAFRDETEIHALLWNAGLRARVGLVWCAGLGAVALLMPNTNRIGERILRLWRERAVYRTVGGSVALCATLLLLVINTARDSISAFIYFNF